MPTSGPVAVVGLGLIGGSLALRLSALGVAVSAYDVDPATRAAAAAAGLTVTSTLDELLDSVGNTDDAVVVLAVPLPAVAETLRAMAARPGPTVTDTTSVKAPVLAAARDAGLAERYVGAHPMAGTAESGFAAATAELLGGARWAVTLETDTDLARWRVVAGLVTALDGRVVPLSAADHDAVVAWVSHLPHVLAEALAAGGADPVYRVLAAGSFRDATRVAATRPALVEAMLAGNAEAVAGAADRLAETLRETAAGLRTGDVPKALVAAGHAARVGPGATTGLTLDPRAPTLAADLLALGRAGGWVSEVGAVLRGHRPV